MVMPRSQSRFYLGPVIPWSCSKVHMEVYIKVLTLISSHDSYRALLSALGQDTSEFVVPL
jgi:hypothetical protein